MGTLEALSTFDWITPALNLTKMIQGYRHISVHWSENPPVFYQKVLRKKGIKVTAGGIVAGKGFVLLVPKDKIAKARRVLAKAGADLA